MQTTAAQHRPVEELTDTGEIRLHGAAGPWIELQRPSWPCPSFDESEISCLLPSLPVTPSLHQVAVVVRSPFPAG